MSVGNIGKKTQTREQDRLDDLARNRLLRRQVATTFFQGQFWFILKNVIGWTLMLIAWPVGIAVPGPGGIPVFLIGFALASVPGKRRITSHVMRGRPIHIHPGPYVAISTAVSVVAVLVLLWFIRAKKEWLLDALQLRGSPTGEMAALIVVVSLIAVVVCWIAIRVGLLGVNAMLRGLPRARRSLRPWLRKYGVNLLPRRREVVDGSTERVNENEILSLSDEGHERLRRAGRFMLVWGIRIAILAIAWWALDRFVFPVTGNPAPSAVQATTQGT
jgi:hypothetical protein